MPINKPHSFALVHVVASSKTGELIPFPWRIIETYPTADGLRSRLTNRMFKDEASAKKLFDQLSKEQK